jgi:hypothetical protein
MPKTLLALVLAVAAISGACTNEYEKFRFARPKMDAGAQGDGVRDAGSDAGADAR